MRETVGAKIWPRNSGWFALWVDRGTRLTRKSATRIRRESLFMKGNGQGFGSLDPRHVELTPADSSSRGWVPSACISPKRLGTDRLDIDNEPRERRDRFAFSERLLPLRQRMQQFPQLNSAKVFRIAGQILAGAG